MAKIYPWAVWKTQEGEVVKREQNYFVVLEAPEGSQYKLGYHYRFDLSELKPLNYLAKEASRRYELLRSKEQELAPVVFQWLKKKGLAELEAQVTVGINISSRVTTTELEPSDWKKILSEEHFEWHPEELSVLKKLKRSKNTSVFVPYDELKAGDSRTRSPKQGQPDVRQMEAYFQTRRLPYILSSESSYKDSVWQGYEIQIIKRLIWSSTRGRKYARRA